MEAPAQVIDLKIEIELSTFVKTLLTKSRFNANVIQSVALRHHALSLLGVCIQLTSLDIISIDLLPQEECFVAKETKNITLLR